MHLSTTPITHEGSKYIRSLSTNKDVTKFLIHLISMRLNYPEKAVWVPISYEFLDKFFKNSGKFRRIMEATELFDKQNHISSASGFGKCTRYKVKDDVFNKIFEIEKNSVTSSSKKVVNLSNGHRFSIKKADDFVQQPLLIQNSINNITQCVINKNNLIYLCNASDLSTADMHNIYKMLLHCDDSNSFVPEYIISSTGRIFEKYGLQILSRKMRKIALEGINYINYDLKASQAAYINFFFKKSNIQCDWLDLYLNNIDFLNRIYEKIPKDMFKTMFYTICFGGNVPNDVLNIKTKTNQELVDKFRKKMSDKEINSTFQMFQNETSDFRISLKKWFNYIMSNEFIKSKTINNNIINSCGMGLNIKELTTTKMAAHLLQGEESFFIHTLTNLSKEFDFNVMSNAHDGLITNCLIPKEAIDKAKLITGHNFITFEQKEI